MSNEHREGSRPPGLPRREFIRITGTAGAFTLVGGTAFLVACKDSTARDNEPGDVPFLVFTNPGDPLFVRADAEGDAVVEYFGTRDATGLPTRVEEIAVTRDGATHRFSLGTNNLPSRISASNGVQFLFNWTGPTEAALTIISASGSHQVNTAIDFSAGGSLAAAPLATSRQPTRRASRPLAIAFHPATDQPAASLADLTGSDVTVNVRRCGTADTGTASVNVVARTPGGEVLLVAPATRVANGVYRTTLPGNIAPTYNPQQLCLSLETALGVPCTALEGLGSEAAVAICSALAVALDVITIPSGEAALMIAACNAAIPGLELYCATLNYSASGSPSLAELLCRAATENRAIATDIVVRAEVVALPTNVLSNAVTVSPGGTVPALTIDLGGQPEIRSLVLNPPNPGQGVDYVATGEVFCIVAGSRVDMTIVGTDEYTDTATYNVTASSVSGQYTLQVPGAESGVQDRVTMTVTLPNGAGTLTRTASLVFGA